MTVLYTVDTFCRIYGQFAMETILATAFGYSVEILRGEVEGDDELIAASARIFATPPTGPVGALLTGLHCK